LSQAGRAVGFSLPLLVCFESKSNNMRTVSSFAAVAPGALGDDGS
jgi:hypothetical protein